MRLRPPSFAPARFFVLRTPLLPWARFAALSAELTAPQALADDAELERALEADHARVAAGLRAMVLDATVREALFVASPSLDQAIESWVADPGGARARGVADILVRYLGRMAGRSTPFGLFAGCSVGTVGAEVRLELEGRDSYRRHSRLDAHYLAALADALHADPGLRSALSYRPSSGLYEAPGQLRYAEGHIDPETRGRSYDLVSVERTEHVDAVLARAKGGARRSELTAALTRRDPEIDEADATAFVDSLIDSQILVSELVPAITGPGSLESILDVLGACDEDAGAKPVLEVTKRALADLDAGGLGNPPERYRQVASALSALPTEPDIARLFQVDLYKPAPRATLGGEPLREIERAVELLARIAPHSEDAALKRFRDAFLERYGERCDGPIHARPMMPLALVLDEEAGIGFGESADTSPLLEGLVLPADPAGAPVSFGAREEAMLRGLTETVRSGSREWVLDERDIAELDSKDPAGLPDAFSVMATLVAPSDEALARGEFRVVAPFVNGPSGAILLGRFCHGDDELRRAVEEHLRAEEALRPDAVFAEIVHLPEGRLGNILARPALRAHEIPFLGRSAVPPHQQISLSELAVTIADGRVVLWSTRLGREVVPRLTSAHNFSRGSLGIYRFLCALQTEHRRGTLGWSWGPLANAPYLPRVRAGRVILAFARWRLTRPELEALAKSTGARAYRAVQELRARRGLPRWVAHVDLDNVLPVDLDNVVAVESWLRLVKGRDAVTLRELLPGGDELVARGPEGAFTHEIVVPFVRVVAEAPQPAAGAVAAPPADAKRTGALPRTFPPGSEWLYAKLYTGTAGADSVLTEVVRPLVHAARETGVIDRWFFLRYGDPHWHVRLRLHGDPGRLAARALPMLHDLAAPLLATGRVVRVELATYEREVERYGGPEGIELAEHVFDADSEAVLSIVERLDAGSGADARWRLALRGCHLLLVDLGLDLPRRAEVVARMRAAFAKEHRVDTDFEGQLGQRYRGERASLEALLAAPVGAEHPLDAGFEALARRSRRLRDAVEPLREREAAGRLTMPLESLAASLIHMHCNRLLRASQRAHELVLYDWLSRLYESQAARARRGRA